MIGKIEDPERPGEEVYVPLRWNDELGRWEVLGKPPGHVSRFFHRIDAGIACWVRLRARYRELTQAARLVRVMCEHPDFDFESDAVSSDMVREQVRGLSLAMSREQEEVDRLLDDPSVDDVVHLRGARYVLDPHTMRLEPHDGDVTRTVPMPPKSPRERFDWLVNVCTLFAKELTGQEHSPLQVEAVVSRVQERLREQSGRGKTER